MDLNSPTDTQDYAGALRAIGQDLADLLPLNLEIEVKDKNFIVTGRGLAESSQMDNAKRNLLGKVWNLLIRHDPSTDILDWQLGSVPFVRTYSQEEISRWDENHFKGRKSTNELPDIYSLGERLRIVGRIVNAKGGCLVNLTKNLNSVAFKYLDETGVIHSEEYTASDLFRIQQAYYSERGTVNDPMEVARSTSISK